MLKARACLEKGWPSVVVPAEMDDFKAVNDCSTRSATNAGLRELARLFDANVRHEQTRARFDGGRFVIVLWSAWID